MVIYNHDLLYYYQVTSFLNETYLLVKHRRRLLTTSAARLPRYQGWMVVLTAETLFCLNFRCQQEGGVPSCRNLLSCAP